MEVVALITRGKLNVTRAIEKHAVVEVHDFASIARTAYALPDPSKRIGKVAVVEGITPSVAYGLDVNVEATPRAVVDAALAVVRIGSMPDHQAIAACGLIAKPFNALDAVDSIPAGTWVTET